jgi:hypothetical protein
LTIESGSCYGYGLKEDIRTNPKIGLSTNIGKEAPQEDGILEPRETGYCLFQKPESTDTLL